MLMLCAAGALLVELTIHILPLLDKFTQNAAIVSAMTLLPEGGMRYLQQQLSGKTASSASSQPSEDSFLGADESSSSSTGQEGASSLASNPEEVDIGETAEAMAAVEVPQEQRGLVLKEHFPAVYDNPSYYKLKNGSIRNTTDLTLEEIEEVLAEEPDLKLTDTDAPQVLLYHTHATESYEPVSREFYDTTYNSRSTEQDMNMIRIGDEIEKQLEEAGIGVIHDTTLHDYPSYNGGYERSAETIQKYLDEYPTIQIVLDIHRDAIERDGTRIAAVSEINGREAAQVMIIAGCDDGTLDIPTWKSNLRFAADLQNNMEGMFPGLTRPVLFSYRRYNQNMSSGSLLLEMGSHGNSLEQAIYAGQLVGKALVETLKGYGAG